MAFCSKCGTQLASEVQFCGACGSPAGTAAAPAQAGLSAPAAAALCYALTFVTGIVFLLVEPHKRDPYVRFHAFQAIFFGVALVVLSIALSVFDTVVLGSGAFALWGLVMLVQTLIWLGALALWIYLMYSAYQQRQLQLPLIGGLARQNAGR